MIKIEQSKLYTNNVIEGNVIQNMKRILVSVFLLQIKPASLEKLQTKQDLNFNYLKSFRQDFPDGIELYFCQRTDTFEI